MNEIEKITKEAANQPTLGEAQNLLSSRLWMQGIKAKPFHMSDLKKEFEKVNG